MRPVMPMTGFGANAAKEAVQAPLFMQQVMERELRTNMIPFSPIVMTADQEDYAMRKKVTWNTNYKLWKLKSNQPQLFANIDRWNRTGGAAPSTEAAPSGFEKVGEGWLFHKERHIYMEEASQRCLWFDSVCGVYRELAAGEDCSSDLVITGAASTSSSSRAPATKGAATSSASSSSSSSAAPARHVVITDLHKAADAYKVEFGHHDRPAAMAAIYKHAEGAVPPDVAAKVLHERLLKRLASFRGPWSDEALQAALVDVLSAVAAESKAAAGVAGAVAIILGQRLAVVASHGASCAIADALPGDMKDVRAVVQSAAGPDAPKLRAACARLCHTSAACILLHTEEMNEQVARVAAAHVERGRPRAGAVTMVHTGGGGAPAAAAAPKPGSAGSKSRAGTGAAAVVTAVAGPSRAAVCLHLGWSGGEDGDGQDGAGGAAAKRPRLEDPKGKSGETSVRCRQILVKYVGCRQPMDSVRKKPIKRSLPEAEAIVLNALSSLEDAKASGGAAASDAAFTKQVRALSECQSSLKGGDLAGDIGWLKMPETKPGEKISKEVAQRMLLVKAAMGLAVHEVSDIIVTDEGALILKRAA